MDASTSDNIPDALAQLRTKPYMVRVVATADELFDDWFLEIDELPADLLVPAAVFEAIRATPGQIQCLGSTHQENIALSLTEPTVPPTIDPTDDLTTLRNLPATHSVTTVDDTLGDLALTYGCERGRYFLEPKVFRLLRKTPYQLLNIHAHNRSGERVTLYLREADSDPAAHYV